MRTLTIISPSNLHSRPFEWHRKGRVKFELVLEQGSVVQRPYIRRDVKQGVSHPQQHYVVGGHPACVKEWKRQMCIADVHSNEYYGHNRFVVGL